MAHDATGKYIRCSTASKVMASFSRQKKAMGETKMYTQIIRCIVTASLRTAESFC